MRQTTCLTIRIQMFGFSNTSEYLNICLVFRPLKVSTEPQTECFRCTKTPFKANHSSVETQLRFHSDGPAPGHLICPRSDRHSPAAIRAGGLPRPTCGTHHLRTPGSLGTTSGYLGGEGRDVQKLKVIPNLEAGICVQR